MANSRSPALLSGEKTVAAAGTAEAVAAAERVKSVVIIAKSGNLGQVYVGGSDVASTTNDGLDAKEALTLDGHGWFDISDIFLDVDTNGDGVDFYAVLG